MSLVQGVTNTTLVSHRTQLQPNFALPILARSFYGGRSTLSYSCLIQYAKSLSATYPEQHSLIDDIIQCVKQSDRRVSTLKEFSQLLLNLERYLLITS
jgi:hypothetical protein